MPHLCPIPCGRLATAAVFVSVAVVQLIAGLILLKSKYVHLLSGPNFWTAASNLAVGVLLGVSANVWKDIQKRSFKHIVRRNILASLLASAIIINSTTALILILGEGNALLSIRLENDGKHSSTTLKSEVLAYSYAISVCFPIVSVVVAIVFLSGMWFGIIDKGMKTPQIKSILKKDFINEYNWVFEKSQCHPLSEPKNALKDLSFKSLSSSSSDESFSSIDIELWSNSVHSIEYLNTALQRGTHRKEAPLRNKFSHEIDCERGEHAKHNSPKKIPHEASRVSFADDMKTIKFSTSSLLEHFEMDAQFHPDNKAMNKSGSAEFKKMRRHYRNSKLSRKRKRITLAEYPAFEQSEIFKSHINADKLSSTKVRIPRAHARMVSKSKSSTPSDVKAEVHVDSKSQSLVDNGSSVPPVVQCEEDISCDDLTETIHSKSTKVERASTFKRLNNTDISQAEDNEFESSFRKVCRTSTAAGVSSPKISQLDISDIQTDSSVDHSEQRESEEKQQNKIVEEFVTSQLNSTFEMDDSCFDVPQSNYLAGEVVEVKVNSLPRKSFHPKLVPVPIPVVSSVKMNNLKRKQGAKGTCTFSCRKELSSFHGDIKANKSISPFKADVEKGLIRNYEVTACDLSPDCDTPQSQAHTSGYDSAIFENSLLSDSHPNVSASNTNSPYYTPKKIRRNPLSPKKLNDQVK